MPGGFWLSPSVGSSSGSGLPSTVVSKTGAYTAAAGDFVEADATSAGFTVTLPTAPATGALVAVKKVDGTTNTVTIAPAGGGTIDGDATAATSTEMAGAIFEHVGSNVWRIVASMTTTGPAGVDGTDGVGVPAGGSAGEVLTKASGTDYDTAWAAGGGGGASGLPPYTIRTGKWHAVPGATNNITCTRGYVYWVPFVVPESATFVDMGFYVGTAVASCVGRLGIYEDDGNGWPGALLLDATGGSTIDLSTTGSKVLPSAISQALTPGVVWLALLATGGASDPVLTGVQHAPFVIPAIAATPGNTTISGVSNAGGSSSLPASATVANIANIAPRLHLKAA